MRLPAVCRGAHQMGIQVAGSLSPGQHDPQLPGIQVAADHPVLVLYDAAAYDLHKHSAVGIFYLLLSLIHDLDCIISRWQIRRLVASAFI